MTFEEADRRYAGLKRRHEDGALSDEEFDSQLKDLLVKDEEGRWWSKSARTGEWYRRTVSGDWVKDFPPPPYQAVDTEPVTEEVPVQTEAAGVDGTRVDGTGNGRNRWRVLFLVFGVVVLLAVLAFAVYLWLKPPPPSPTVAVPDLVGMKLDEAENRHSDKVDIRVEREVESKEPVQTIRRQDPEDGKVKKGSTIWVDVVETQMADVPGVGGKEADEARKMLEDAKLNVAEDEEQSSSGAEGSVVDQNPAGGTTVEVGSEVTITVGTGPPEPTTPEPTTQPEPQSSILVDDNFSDTSSGWPNGEIGRYSDGGYLLDTGDLRYVFATGTAATIEDVIVEVEATDVTIDPTGTNYWGVACRIRDVNNMYVFVITNHGGYSIWKLVDGRWTLLTPQGTSSNAFTPTETNRIRAGCEGSTLSLYVNDSLLLEATDTEFRSGQVGLYAEDGVTRSGKDGPAPVKVWFDNFKAREP